MGRRSGAETVIALLSAFVERRTWRQAELARHLELTTPTLRKHLLELGRMFPLDAKSEPPDVFWSVPSRWQPQGTLLQGAEVAAMVRMLARSPKTAERERLVALLLMRQPRVLPPSKIEASALTTEEEQFLNLVEDAASRRQALHMKYYSSHRGDSGFRVVSVVRVLPGPPSRFWAVCHRSSHLKSFRVGDIASAHVDVTEAYRDADPAELERRTRDAVDGWFSEATGELVFLAHPPEARWIKRNLPDGMRTRALPDGVLEVTASASGLPATARFVVGLGAAATCQTPELATAVRELAQGALQSNGGRAKRLDKRSVVRIRTGG